MGAHRTARIGPSAGTPVIDEILNAILFLLIGLKVIAIAPDARFFLLGVFGIGVMLLARTLSVGVPFAPTRPFLSMGSLALPTLVWRGLRGVQRRAGNGMGAWAVMHCSHIWGKMPGPSRQR